MTVEWVTKYQMHPDDEQFGNCYKSIEDDLFHYHGVVAGVYGTDHARVLVALLDRTLRSVAAIHVKVSNF